MLFLRNKNYRPPNRRERSEVEQDECGKEMTGGLGKKERQ